ncbi:hypothetical protein ISS40_07070 [Candidatus Bathyarchaeota archaeon]|nr:hypothetical protein [Candidatus Bathyarchaeota archaeon]
MWPERLLQVSQAIRDSVDDSRLDSFFNLARLSEPRNLEIDEYNAELSRVLHSLVACAVDLFQLSGNLSVALNGGLRADINDVHDKVNGLVGLFSPSLKSSRPHQTGEAALSQLLALDFAVIARLSDLCTAATRLSMAVEEEDQDGVSGLIGWVGSITSNVEVLWGLRPQHMLGGGGLGEVIPEEVGSHDFEAGLHLVELRLLKLDDKPVYLRELSMIVHAVMEEVRGSRDRMSLNEFFDRLSCVSLFLSIGFKDVMFCFAELLERGWTGGIKDVGERQMLEIRQPDLGRLDSKLKDAFLGTEVTTKKVMERLDLDYFTSLHVIKETERSGELEFAEFEAGPLWRWREA